MGVAQHVRSSTLIAFHYVQVAIDYFGNFANCNLHVCHFKHVCKFCNLLSIFGRSWGHLQPSWDQISARGFRLGTLFFLLLFGFRFGNFIFRLFDVRCLFSFFDLSMLHLGTWARPCGLRTARSNSNINNINNSTSNNNSSNDIN